MDPMIMKSTQDSLGKFVKKPPLSDKLLQKPPFRFLHDVVTAVVKSNGNLNNLYSTEELNSENIRDKDGKITFLQKLIDVLNIATNKKITARPSKIVAGQEPEKTNEMLQALGFVIENKIDCSDAINVVLSKSKAENKQSNEKIPKSKFNDATKSNKNDLSSIEAKKAKVRADKTEKNANKASGSVEVTKIRSDKNVKKKILGSVDPIKKVGSKLATETAKIQKTGSTESELKTKKITKISSTESESTRDKKSSSINTEKISKAKESKSSKASKVTDKRRTSVTSDDGSKKIQDETEKVHNILEDMVTVTAISRNVEHKADLSSGEQKRKMPDSSGSIDYNLDEKKRIESKDSNQTNSMGTTNEILNEKPQKSSSAKSKDAESRKTSASSRKSSIDKGGHNKDLTLQALKENNKDIQQQQMKKVKNDNVEKVISDERKEVERIVEVKRQSTFVRENSKENLARPKTSLRPPSVRPPSARPGAPRRRDKNIEIVLQPNDQIKLAGIKVKVENYNVDLEDDGDNLVIIENSNTQVDEIISREKNNNENIENTNLDEEQGHLVQQIMETQKELTIVGTDPKDKKEELDASRNHERQSSAKQMNSLRDIIQNITRSVNPLGKLMDFIPEDIDSMQLELTMWRDAYGQASLDLKREKSLTESAIEPMKNQLIQINNNIKEYQEMIDNSRGKILQNSEKIIKLLTEH